MSNVSDFVFRFGNRRPSFIFYALVYYNVGKNRIGKYQGGRFSWIPIIKFSDSWKTALVKFRKTVFFLDTPTNKGVYLYLSLIVTFSSYKSEKFSTFSIKNIFQFD